MYSFIIYADLHHRSITPLCCHVSVLLQWVLISIIFKMEARSRHCCAVFWIKSQSNSYSILVSFYFIFNYHGSGPCYNLFLLARITNDTVLITCFISHFTGHLFVPDNILLLELFPFGLPIELIIWIHCEFWHTLRNLPYSSHGELSFWLHSKGKS